MTELRSIPLEEKNEQKDIMMHIKAMEEENEKLEQKLAGAASTNRHRLVKQKGMPGEASKNRSTLQEDYEAEGEVRDLEESIVELEQEQDGIQETKEQDVIETEKLQQRLAALAVKNRLLSIELDSLEGRVPPVQP